jgi:L-amino acid N-acyltransferase YncA
MSAFFGSSYICIVYIYGKYIWRGEAILSTDTTTFRQREKRRKQVLGENKFPVYLATETHQLQDLEDSGRRFK